MLFTDRGWGEARDGPRDARDGYRSSVHEAIVVIPSEDLVTIWFDILNQY
jgi:hypothetical protein